MGTYDDTARVLGSQLNFETVNADGVNDRDDFERKREPGEIFRFWGYD